MFLGFPCGSAGKESSCNAGTGSMLNESESRSVVSDSLRPNSPGQNTGVGSPSLLQGIFPTQGSNPGLLHCRQILYQLSHKGSPRILEWVAYPFSSGSSWARNQTRVSCTAGGFFTNWAIREALIYDEKPIILILVPLEVRHYFLLFSFKILSFRFLQL